MQQIILTQKDTLARKVKSALEEFFSTAGECNFSITQASELSEIVLRVKKAPRSIVVLDFAEDEMRCVSLLLRLLKERQRIEILITNSGMPPQLIHCLFRCGVKGHLDTQANSQAICQAIIALQRQHYYLSPVIVSQFIEWVKVGAGSFIQNLSLTDSFLIYFAANERAADKVCFALNMTRRTMKRHLGKLYKKLFVNNIKGLRNLYSSFLFQNSES